jgi:hypothetical protein
MKEVQEEFVVEVWVGGMDWVEESGLRGSEFK